MKQKGVFKKRIEGILILTLAGFFLGLEVGFLTYLGNGMGLMLGFVTMFFSASIFTKARTEIMMITYQPRISVLYELSGIIIGCKVFSVYNDELSMVSLWKIILGGLVLLMGLVVLPGIAVNYSKIKNKKDIDYNTDKVIIAMHIWMSRRNSIYHLEKMIFDKKMIFSWKLSEISREAERQQFAINILLECIEKYDIKGTWALIRLSSLNESSKKYFGNIFEVISLMKDRKNYHEEVVESKFIELVHSETELKEAVEGYMRRGIILKDQ